MDGDKQSEEKQRLRSTVIYETVRREGKVELDRPVWSLWWSGIAAGIALCSSLLAVGLLRFYLPDVPWAPAVESLGYCVGFVIVIQGRLQLFTEQTVSAVLPLLAESTLYRLWRTARLWGVVLVANLTGVLVTMAITIFAETVHPEYVDAMFSVAGEFAQLSVWQAWVYGIPAGFFIAAIVWMLPNSHGQEVWLIILMTYLIALGGFAHIVVVAAKVFMLMLAGNLGVIDGLFGLVLPCLIGNIIGGTGLFALLAYGQVQEEL